jgi:hypothetical protein
MQPQAVGAIKDLWRVVLRAASRCTKLVDVYVALRTPVLGVNDIEIQARVAENVAALLARFQ